MSEDIGSEKGTILEIKGEVGVDAQSNLQALFRENCQLHQQALVFLNDGLYVPEKYCSTAKPPATATEEGLERDNEILKQANEQLQVIDPQRAY